MSRWFVLVLMTGCSSPSVQPGRPCSEDGSCPPGQACDPDEDGPVATCSARCDDETPVCDVLSQTCRIVSGPDRSWDGPQIVAGDVADV